MNKTFYQNIDLIDKYIHKSNPTRADSLALQEWIFKEEYARYIFKNLESPKWIQYFYELDVFEKFPGPVEDENNKGYFRMPAWYAGDYLNRFAATSPEIVNDIALNMKTENSRVIRTILNSLNQLPPKYSANITDSIAEWVESSFFGNVLILEELGKMIDHLVKGDFINEALSILNFLSKPFPIEKQGVEGKFKAGTKFDIYWLDKIFEDHLLALIEVDPVRVIEIIESSLLDSLVIEYGEDNQKSETAFWAHRIDPDKEGRYHSEIKYLLKDYLIYAIVNSVQNHLDEIGEILDRYLESKNSIIYRISVYVLTFHADNFTHLFEKAYINYLLNDYRLARADVIRLINNCYDHFPKYIQKIILGDIYSIDSEAMKNVEEKVEKYGKEIEGDSKIDKIMNFIERIHLDQLEGIKESLKEGDSDYYSYLVKKHGMPKAKVYDGEVQTFTGSVSPIELTELSKETIPSVISYLINFVPTDKGWMVDPSIEGLGRVFQSDVKNRVIDYAKEADLLKNSRLLLDYHANYFLGIETALKKESNIDFENVIDLIHYVSFLQQETDEKFDTLRYVKTRGLSLLERLMYKKEYVFTHETINKIEDIIDVLLEYELGKPSDENEDNFDPVTRSLNSVRGMAMHCLVAYGLYENRRAKDNNKEQASAKMSPFVKRGLTRKLNKSNDPCLGVHSVFGQYLPQLNYLDDEWVSENIEKIFPRARGKFKYWYAAWNSYLSYSDVFTETFPKLISQYDRYLDSLSDSGSDENKYPRDNKISSHLLKAYLLNLIDIDSEDNLLINYYQKSDDKSRSHGVFWLSQVLETQKPKEEDDIWIKTWNLWKWRLEVLASQNAIESNQEEISSFSRFLKSVPIEFSEVYPVLNETLRYIWRDFEVGLVINYLVENSNNYPELTNSILLEMIKSRKELYIRDKIIDSVRHILSSAIEGNQKSKKIAIETINILGELEGVYELRPLLEDLEG